MKQEMISFLSTIENRLFDLTKYLHDNPEKSFHEYKSYNYIIKLLQDYNFNVSKNYLNIPTSFLAKLGEGHPKICFICEYDADENSGHIYGYNGKTTISIAAAIMLSKIISKVSGTCIVLGCPGEILHGSKTTMFKQGTFNDIDAVLAVQPHVVTAQSGSSMATLPIQFKFEANDTSMDLKNVSPCLNTSLITFNTLNALINNLDHNCIIDNLNLSSSTDLNSKSSEITFSIRSASSKDIMELASKIKDFVKVLSSLLNINYEYHLTDVPCKELITSCTISRLFSHNLKENGIINIDGVNNIYSCLNLGIVSHSIPCIHPYVSITEDSSIKYGTKRFADETITHYAHDTFMKSAKALAFTALDLIENKNLLFEAKSELTHK
ncbi:MULTISPECIES: amidohydrolase [Clostridium]|uniref:amidohydrolase n=1 Tax=Clostridium TaxID=1485 RepID=UPI0008246E7A|nr:MULTISPECIES: amidohydrolase [Clostridium]PJI08062.1 amidohydrolase [Clostridium sp. CT7]